MKTKFYFLPILLLGGLSLFTACSDDDIEKEGGQPAAPVIGYGGTNSGARLTSITAGWGGTTHFQYNEDGTVQRIFEEYDGDVKSGIAMTYNPFHMETYEISGLKKTSFNQNGYLTRMYAEGTYRDEEYDSWEKYKTDWRYSYNSNGNLKNIYYTYSCNGVEDGEKFFGQEMCTATYTWSEGNLTRIEFVAKVVDDEGTRISNVTYDFEYTDEINKYKQYVSELNKLETDYDEMLASIGWLGKWTKNYPASFVCKSILEDDDDKYEEDEYEELDKIGETYTGTWSNFSTTSDGLLSGFNYYDTYIRGGRYTYTYDNTAPTAKKAAAKQMLDKNAPSPRTKKMSRRHLHHARMLNRK